MSENFKKAVSFLDKKDYENAREYFLKSYEKGIKKSAYYLRKIRHEEGSYKRLNKNLSFEKIKSNLGFEVEIPTHFEKLSTIDDKCFDIITVEKEENFEFFNIKTTGFLIEIPKDCVDLVSINSIIKNMTNIDEIRNYENKNIKGKLIISRSNQGVINYTLMTNGCNGIYEFKIEVDEFLADEYKDIIRYIFNSFYIIEK